MSNPTQKSIFLKYLIFIHLDENQDGTTETPLDDTTVPNFSEVIFEQYS